MTTLDKKNILLLRGLGRVSEHWGNFPRLLHGNVHFLDLPGVGKTIAPRSIDSYVEILRSQWRNLDKEKPNIIVGLSLGGMIAMKWMELYPEDFELGFIINSSAKNLSSTIERFNPINMIKACKQLLKQSKYGAESFIFQMTSNQKLNLDIINKWVEIRKNKSVSFVNLLRQLYAAHFFKVGNVDGNKIKIITGKNDKLCSWNCGDKLAKTFGCDFYQIKGGHDLSLDNPHELANIINSYS